MIDDRGRLFGRINLVDATVAAFLILLVPLGYATYLLFKPTQPRIVSVSPSLITKEERRIGVGARLVAKFKVKGTGFTPLLRARIGDVDALGFVFENPNSADVLVGAVPAGAHDLVLLDGVQEVARAAGAISVQPEEASFIRAVGWLTKLGPDLAAELRVGLAFPSPVPSFEIVALGPLQPARTTIRLGGSSTEIPAEGQDREAVMLLRCEPGSDDNPCAMGERLENNVASVVLSVMGPTRPFSFLVTDLLPAAEARPATIRMQLDATAPASLTKVGDRDGFLDGRAAVVSRIERAAGATILTLTLGVDAGRDGWIYRRQTLKPGSRFVFRAEDYDLHGIIVGIDATSGTAK
jgi:hypothetical protein